MKKKKAYRENDVLRREAAETEIASGSMEPGDMTPEAVRTLIHELQVRQTELETENKELRSAQAKESQAHSEELRTKAEELRKSQEAIRSLELFPEQNSSPVLRIDDNGCLLYANPASESLLAQWQCAIGQHVPESVDQTVKAALAQTVPQELETDIDGRRIAFVVSPVREFNYANLYGLDVTGRKLAEESLKKAKASLEAERDVLQTVMNGARNSHLVYLDRDFNFVRVNETYAKTCGYTPEQMVGKGHFALYPHAENEEIFARVRDTGIPAEFHDKPFVFPDQPERGVTYWDWTLIPVKSSSGFVEGLVFSLFETTERKMAEEALQKANEQLQMQSKELHAQAEELQAQAEELTAINEELREREQLLLVRSQELEKARREAENERHRLEAVMEALPVGMAIVDARGGNVRFNNAYDQIWRGPRPTPLSVSEYADYKAWWPDTGKAVAPEEWASAIAVQKGETVVGQLMEIQRFDGSRGFIINSAAPVRDAAGNIIGSAVAIQDITDLHKAEKALKRAKEELELRVQERTAALSRANELLERMFSGIHVLIAYLDKDFNFIRVNRAYAEADGKPPEFFIGKNHFALYPNEENEEIFKRVVTTGQPCFYYAKPFKYAEHPERGISYWDWSLHPVKDPAGNVEGLLFSLVDCTERVRAQEAVRELNKELEHRVIERTAELEAANKEIEAFSYSVSHDLRAPLRSIDGFSKALLEDYGDKLDEIAKDYLNRVCGGAQKMGELIDAMLSLSRLTRNELVRRRVNLTAIATEIAGELKRTEPERRVEFVIAEDVIAQADAAMIRAVLDNLLRNAWKFTAKHEKSRIEFGAEKKTKETVYFVRDDGAGFNMNYANKLFNAFQRLHRVTDFPGIGIGLATVQRIIHRHGGRIWAEGEVEKGATFYFTLG